WSCDLPKSVAARLTPPSRLSRHQGTDGGAAQFTAGGGDMEGVAAREKRAWLVLWWIGQALVAYFGLPLLYWTFDGAKSGADFAKAYGDPEYAAWILGIVTFLSVLQGLFLMPVRPPTGRGPKKSLVGSATAGGFVVATTLAAALFALFELFHDYAGESKNDDGRYAFWTILALFVTTWIVATPLCVKFVSRAATPEDGLARLATKLFAGTLVEVVSAMPLD